MKIFFNQTFCHAVRLSLFVMKTRLLLPLLFLMLCIWGNLHAQQRGRGEIAIRSGDGEKLGIEVDGRRYDRFSSDLLLGNIPPGRRSVIVYRLRPHNSDGGATAQTVYEGQVLVRAGYRILMDIDPKSGSVSIRQQDLMTGPMQPSLPSERPAPSGRPAPTPPLAIPQNNDWQTQVEGKNTDTEKLRILKARVTARSLSTTDVLQMMNTLAFEDSRLELAKAALPNISDRENLNTLSSAFENPDSRKSFEEAARRMR